MSAFGDELLFQKLKTELYGAMIFHDSLQDVRFASFFVLARFGGHKKFEFYSAIRLFASA